MASRVVGSRIGGLPELVHEGRTGLLFEPGDAGRTGRDHAGLISGARDVG